MRTAILAVILLSLIAVAGNGQGKKELSRSERKEKLAQLSEEHRRFLADVEPIILPTERDTFLVLETGAQRDLYIEDFWARRDPVGSSPDNRYRHSNADVKFRLGRLAVETGGGTFYIDSAEQLRSVYDRIEEELRSQYLLGFYPAAEVKPGGAWREVRVEVEGAKARTVRGYYP